MDFARPDLLWLLLLAPLAGVFAFLAWRRRLRAAAAWAAKNLWNRLLPGYDARRLRASQALLALAVLGTALALAQPRWGQSSQTVEREGVDVVFVLDTSLSMATTDVQVDRLWVAQSLIRRLVRELPGNRVALVQAEGGGEVLVPLTADSAAVEMLLDAVLTATLPTPGTELGPALDRAVELFPDEGSKHQVLVLLSDGEDHGSTLQRTTATLQERGVVAHAIGVGTEKGKPLELPAHLLDMERLFPESSRSGATPPSPGGSGARYKLDGEGKVVISRLVETTLEELSRETGGHYLRATSAAADLEPIVSRIADMEQKSYGSEMVSSLEERFQWPMTLAVVALFLHLAVAPFRRAVTEEP